MCFEPPPVPYTRYDARIVMFVFEISCSCNRDRDRMPPFPMLMLMLMATSQFSTDRCWRSSSENQLLTMYQYVCP